MKGKIKKVVAEKGYGFIVGEEDGQEYFFHHSGLVGTRMDTLEAGDPVSFEEDLDTPNKGKGPRAAAVRVL